MPKAQEASAETEEQFERRLVQEVRDACGDDLAKLSRAVTEVLSRNGVANEDPARQIYLTHKIEERAKANIARSLRTQAVPDVPAPAVQHHYSDTVMRQAQRHETRNTTDDN